MVHSRPARSSSALIFASRRIYRSSRIAVPSQTSTILIQAHDNAGAPIANLGVVLGMSVESASGTFTVPARRARRLARDSLTVR